jgi:transcriptional regulator with XRE-family HTH domain
VEIVSYCPTGNGNLICISYSKGKDCQRRDQEWTDEPSLKRHLKDVVEQLDETFQERLFRLIDEKGLTDIQVYKKANIDRKLFSKIRCNINYKPSKATVLALAIALGLNLDETTDLLGRAGLALSPSSKADLIVKYCIINKIHDILDVNAILYEYDQPLLGC